MAESDNGSTSSGKRRKGGKGGGKGKRRLNKDDLTIKRRRRRINDKKRFDLFKSTADVGDVMVTSRVVQMLKAFRNVLMERDYNSDRAVRISTDYILKFRQIYAELLREILLKSLKQAAFRSGFKRWSTDEKTGEHITLESDKKKRFRLTENDIITAQAVCSSSYII